MLYTEPFRLLASKRDIIDSPYFQRLHFILQNSVTYTAYPTNKNTRFIHSLGVSHLAGNIFSTALGHSSGSTLTQFFEDASSFITNHFVNVAVKTLGQRGYLDSLFDAWSATILGQSRFYHSPFISSLIEDGPILKADDEFGELRTDFLSDTLWQSIRICGLVHDVGHLPMSHSFEGGIEAVDHIFQLHPNLPAQNPDAADNFSNATEHTDDQRLADDFSALLSDILGLTDEETIGFLNTIPIHEKRSLLIFNAIFSENRQHFENEIQNYRNIIYKLSFLILFASATDKLKVKGNNPPPLSSFLRVMKGIVASEVDADRIDYTVRDGMACASLIGVFEFDRLVKNAILHKDQDQTYKIAYYQRSLSGIEKFFHTEI